jgi:hypothetical protein
MVRPSASPADVVVIEVADTGAVVAACVQARLAIQARAQPHEKT